MGGKLKATCIAQAACQNSTSNGSFVDKLGVLVQRLFIFRKVSPLPLGEGQGEGVSTQTDLPQLLPLQGELSHTSALSPRERENEKALGTRNCSDWGRYGLGEDGIESMVRVASLQTPGAEQGSHDALGLAALCGAGTAADLAAHHRRTKAPLRRVVVRSRSWLNYEGE